MLGQPRPVQIATLRGPQHETWADSSSDPGGKARRGGAIFLIGAAAENFVHRPQCQPAARQGAVDRSDMKRQYPMAQGARPFDPADAVLQGDEGGG